MPPGFRGRGRGGGRGGGASRGGGSSSRGRGRGNNRGRGSRGRGRGGPSGGIRSHDNRPRDNHPKFEEPSSDEDEEEPLPSEDEDDDDATSEISTDSEPEEAATAKPYSVLLQSLASSKKDNEEDHRKAKRRKLEHGETEDAENDEVEWVDEHDEAEEETPDVEGEDSDDEDASDPFEAHFANPSPEYLSGIAAASKNEWQNKKLAHPGVAGKILFSAPIGSQAQPGKKVEGLKDIKLKKRLEAPFSEVNGEFTQLQKALAPYVFSHQDVLFCSRTLGNAKELRRIICLHALNHIFKTRDKVLKNNARLSRGGEETEDLELRDQGFTRPKVLFILPTRNACAEVLETVISLAQPEQQENKKRFQESYVHPEEEERIGDNKPDDFRDLFKGNHDDMFRIGLKFTRKTVKLFSQFYNSDIMFASPLGLRMAIGDENDKKRDYDFLSSVELVVVDQADALLMQNWDHVEHVFKHLNLIPKDAHGCDFGRVRNWYLDSNAKYLRQTIVLSQFITPELNSLFTNHMRNIGGRVKTQAEYAGSMTDLGLQVRQTFSRFDSPNPSADPSARFKYFTTAILPALLRAISSGGILIFIPSYFDFVRVRNHLDTLGISFGTISEETSISAVARARSHFLTGRHSVLLYTGRAHHFRRYVIRGVSSVVFYTLPDNPVFYREIAGDFLLRTVGEGKVDADGVRVRVLFSKWDAMRLERVVGSSRVRVMCTDVGDTFEFV